MVLLGANSDCCWKKPGDFEHITKVTSSLLSIIIAVDLGLHFGSCTWRHLQFLYFLSFLYLYVWSEQRFSLTLVLLHIPVLLCHTTHGFIQLVHLWARALFLWQLVAVLFGQNLAFLCSLWYRLLGLSVAAWVDQPSIGWSLPWGQASPLHEVVIGQFSWFKAASCGFKHLLWRSVILDSVCMRAVEIRQETHAFSHGA